MVPVNASRAASVLALLALVACQQGTPSASVSATTAVSSSPPVSSGRAPAGVPLVLFRHGAEDSGDWDSGAGWDGRFYDLTEPLVGVVSPDGEHLLRYFSGGSVVADRDTGAQHDLRMSPITARWADDNRHLCLTLDRPGSPGAVGPNGRKQEGLTDLWWVDAVTGDRRLVAHFGSWAFNGWVPDITTCSATSDLAALDIPAIKTATYNELYVVRISTGSVIQDLHLSADSYPVMSHD